MNAAFALLVTIGLAAPFAARAGPGKFDGPWDVTLTCPAHNERDDDAKGYTHQFPAEVAEGRLRGVHGKEGEPGWHLLQGEIGADGDARLRLDGIVNNPRYAINDAQRGKAYTYRVMAHFDENSGLGQRVTSRSCEFRFSRGQRPA